MTVDSPLRLDAATHAALRYAEPWRLGCFCFFFRSRVWWSGRCGELAFLPRAVRPNTAARSKCSRPQWVTYVTCVMHCDLCRRTAGIIRTTDSRLASSGLLNGRSLQRRTPSPLRSRRYAGVRGLRVVTPPPSLSLLGPSPRTKRWRSRSLPVLARLSAFSLRLPFLRGLYRPS